MDFVKVWRRLTGQSQKQAEDVMGTLNQLYSSGRSYHNMRHVEDCLLQLGDLFVDSSHAEEVALALWFHDAIYDTRSHENEARSANLFRLLSQGMDLQQQDRIYNMIMATKDHVPRNELDKLILDIDLSILGRPEEAFDEYDKAIREEYSWVPLEVYCDRRAKVLQGFLQRDRVFHTDYFHHKYEATARSNLKRAIKRLLSSGCLCECAGLKDNSRPGCLCLLAK